MRFPVFLGEKPPVLCAGKRLSRTTGSEYIMGVHRGEKFPCGKCGKVLASKCYWRDHTQSCMQGKTVACLVCKKPFASAQSMRNHHRAKHGADSVVPEGGFVCPFCDKSFQVKKTWSEHKPYCANNPD